MPANLPWRLPVLLWCGLAVGAGGLESRGMDEDAAAWLDTELMQAEVAAGQAVQSRWVASALQNGIGLPQAA